MPETLEKLRPDRDLQCYFERPSAIGAIHSTSATGFKVSGTWRQQFDWVVLEWNRDNVIEHPLFRYLPDGDLSGLQLVYDETRTNCIPLDSSLYPTVDWPYLRIWADSSGVEEFYQIALKDYASAIEGDYTPAWAEMELQGTPTTGDYVGLSFLGENHTYQLYTVDTLVDAVEALVDSINAFSNQMIATSQGATIRLTYVGEGQTVETSTTGANGNRIGVYGFVSGAETESWSPWWNKFSGGVSPTKWRVTLPFDSLTAIDERSVPTNAVRKMRWTYSADLQDSAYERSEFEVEVSNWTVTGTNRLYSIAGPGSRRIEDSSGDVEYSGAWNCTKGNYSGGTISHATSTGAEVSCEYVASQTHSLYLGTRSAYSGAQISIIVDSEPAQVEDLLIPGEDVLRRISLGQFGAGSHTVTITHVGPEGGYFYFDFLEIAIPDTNLPELAGDAKLTLATDWDTDHSIAVPPERTAWMIYALGFHGRVNHYVGALWFYELHRPGHQYASATLNFIGTPEFSQSTEIRIGRVGYPPEQDTVITHLNLIGDTADTIAKAFELDLNSGYTAVRAESENNTLNVISRSMGEDGNQITISATSSSGNFYVQVSGSTLAGGVDGDWRTDLTALPRLNRAVRDWCSAFYTALDYYGLDVVAAFSMELQHGDPSTTAGIAQRYPNGDPAWLNTPALQTNFSPESTSFWKQVYLDMAGLMDGAGYQPYLQFGEVQWWYFPLLGSGMPFYDDYTKTTFQSTYGYSMNVIADNTVDPDDYPDEAELLPALIGNFTSEVMSFVRSTYPTCRFEVLYPTDVNDTPLNEVINYPTATWTPANLDCLKTESFTFTYTRDLDACRGTISYGQTLGFPRDKRSFLVGIGDSTTTWLKELRYALAENVESIVLFALDQFCLIGYEAPPPNSHRRSLFMG